MNNTPVRNSDDQEAPPSIQPGPVIDRSGNAPGFGRLLLLGIILVAMAGLFAVVEKPALGQMIFAVLGILAMIGVFFLFSLALGVVHISSRTRGEEFGKSYVDSMAEGTVVTDLDGRILYANRAYASLLGAESAEDVSTMERVFSVEPESSETIYKMSHAVRDGKQVKREFRMPNGIGTSASQNGHARWYRVKARPLKLPDQKQPLAAWQVADISDERAAQESAFQDLQHAIDYLDHAPAGFFSAEADGSIVYVNATLADWLGIELTQFTPGSLRVQDLVLGESMALLDSVQPDPGSSKTAVIDLDLAKMNGQSLPVRLYHKVPFANDGAPGATRTLVLNRSAGEGTSEALRAAEVRFARFFNNTPFAIASVAEDGQVIETNAAFRNLFSQLASTNQLASGFKITSLVHQRDRERFDTALSSAAEGRGNINTIDSSLPDNEDVSIRYYISAVVDGEEDGEVAILYAVDMTDQRALEAQMAQTQKMQAVGQLAGGIAHDFNNVLTAIIGFSDLLLANHRASDPSFPDIMNIKQNANRAASLVRQLLAFSRRQTLRPQVLSLPDVMTDLRMLLERLLGDKAKLTIKHGRDLWPVKADIGQFEQVIVNLCVNARDALPNGGTVTITTFNAEADLISGSYARKEMPAADYVIIEVTDDGTGMSEVILKQIFEPFFSTKEVGKGTGLGLSTVYGIVKQSGGFIYVDSEEGSGTTFRLFLPRHIPAENSETEETSVGTSGEARDLSGSASILLVEDEDAVRSFGVRALEMRGYTVFEADSGVEALEVMEQHGDEIDLVVSDVVMPEMDGPTLLGKLRKTHKDLKFIFVSGYAEEAFAKNLPEEERGKFGFLPKPFSLKQLATTVKEMLEQK